MPEVYLAAVLVLGLQYCILNPHRLGKQSRVYSVMLQWWILWSWPVCFSPYLQPPNPHLPMWLSVFLEPTMVQLINKVVHHTSRPDTEIFQSLESFLSSLCGKRIAGLHWWATGRAHFPGKLMNGRCSLLTEPWTFLSIFTILGLGDNQRPLTTVLSPHLIPSLGDSALLLDSGYLFYLTLPS